MWLHRTVVNGWQVRLVHVESVRLNDCRGRNVNATSGWTVGYATGRAPLMRSCRATAARVCPVTGYIARAVLTPTSLSCTNETRERTKRKNITMVQQRQILSKTVTKKSNETGKLNVNQQIKRRQRNTVIVKMDQKE